MDGGAHGPFAADICPPSPQAPCPCSRVSCRAGQGWKSFLDDACPNRLGHHLPMTAAPPSLLTRTQIARQAVPIILAGASVPLLGMVDTAVIGHYGSAAELGALAVGALLFNFLYWAFGFLRMATTGFVAQAAGGGQAVRLHAAVVAGAGDWPGAVVAACPAVAAVPCRTGQHAGAGGPQR